jgi:DNA-binding NarL/FixJ family response regulator
MIYDQASAKWSIPQIQREFADEVNHAMGRRAAAMAGRVRAVTPEEEQALRQRAPSRTEAARMVERAKIVGLTARGHFAPAVANRLGIADATVRTWVTRFNTQGRAG